MKHIRWVLLISSIVIAFSCTSFISGSANQSNNLLTSPSSGFSKEIDEPTSRGLVKRISPEQIDVQRRFDVSPDGKAIVYSGRQQPFSTETYSSTQSSYWSQPGQIKVYDLWKIDVAGGAPVKLTSGSDSDFWSPSFTSDGQFIVYESKGQLWKVRADGAGGKVKLPGSGGGNDKFPHVSKDGKIVFYSIESEKRIIWTINEAGGDLTQIREGMTPRWSPDGKLICFSFEDDIWLINSDGTNMVQLTSSNSIIEGLPSFSPEGDKLVFVSNEGKNATSVENYNLWTMKTDGTEKTQITELDSWDSWPIWKEEGIYFLSARGIGKEKYIRIWLRSNE